MKPEKVSGFCNNCKEMKVVYDWDTEKYWCRNCNKVKVYDFTVMCKEDIE